MTEHQPELIPQTNVTTTPEDQAKRDEYRRRLAEYLKDPVFRAIEGFPIGTDEDILALSDPPYYTACPNPFLPEIIDQWQLEREEIRQKLGLNEEKYQREPFAADVSEGKNDPIYNAHSYHTKVPHKAIMRYILHYTDPGDIVFDGFCGTGMTGVAAQLCGDKKTVESLGYRVDDKGVVREGDKAISRLGARKAVLNDLSPAATFIAYNYNTPVDAAAFEKEAKRILAEVEQECGWMYETWHPNCEAPNRVKGKINYTVWSDVLVCPQCGIEMVFSDVAFNKEKNEMKDSWLCPGCSVRLSKHPGKEEKDVIRVEKAWEMHFDREINQTIRQAKQVPVLINYSFQKKRFEKKLDRCDKELIQKLEMMDLPSKIPYDQMPDGFNTHQPKESHGLTHVHHFYTRRSLFVLGEFIRNLDILPHRLNMNLNFLHGSILPKITKMNRYMPQHGSRALVGPLANTLYIPSMWVENNVLGGC